MKAVFNDSFSSKCLGGSVPTSLLTLDDMVLNGPSITERSNSESLPAYQMRKEAYGTAKHSQLRETALPVNLSVMIHTKSRKRE